MWIIGIIILFFLVFSLLGFYLAIRPFRIISNQTPANYALNFEAISFKTEDNVTIKGWFIPSKTPNAKTIILLHGYPADKGNILPSREFLHKKYNLVFIDFRYHGESGGVYSTVGKNEVLDVLATLHFLHERGINEVGIWGFSLGAATALMAAIDAPEVKAVVAESSYAELSKLSTDYFRLPYLKFPLAALTRLWTWLFLGYDLKSVSPAESASKLKIPVLLIHSRGDTTVPFEHAEIFQKKLSKNSNVKFLFLDDLTHGTSSQKIQTEVEGFFDEFL